MKLERFEKNKKKKVYIVLSITVVLLVSVFVLYKSFALYEERKEFNVINGVIPDFNKSDIKLAYTINGNQSNEAFPRKEDNYQVKSVECEKGVTASWNSELWGLVDINSNGNKTISCTVNFNSKEPICKKATTLHTTLCPSDDDVYGCYKLDYSKGDTITYGQIGPSEVLNLGDAFDCDVNGDGIYDSETERFYYVNDLEGYNDTAVLIYYKNTARKSDSMGTTYNLIDNEEFAGFCDNKGPVEAAKVLPTKDEWSNIKLKNPIRNIVYSEDNSLEAINFDYTDYAARLLSYTEIKNQCQDLKNCQFLLENTFFDGGYSSKDSDNYWTETITKTKYGTGYTVYYIDGQTKILDDYVCADRMGVRPVIEIDKSDIDY